MSMTVWNPFREMEALLDRYSQATGRTTLGNDDESLFYLSDWSPTVDIEESDESYLVKADLPGVKRENIEVSFDNGMLSIQGEKREEKEGGTKGAKRHRTERFTGRFARSFTLPAAVKRDAIDANYRDGVLTLMIPKADEAKPRSIDINVV